MPWGPRWNAENLKLKGVLVVPGTDILFIEVRHPAAAGLLLLNKMSRIENYYRINAAIFCKECDRLRLLMLPPKDPITRSHRLRLSMLQSKGPMTRSQSKKRRLAT
jgi:hypothetical protein